MPAASFPIKPPPTGGRRRDLGYLLGGCPVYLGGEGWAAEFWVTDGYITQFTLNFRSYAPNGEHTLLLPIDKVGYGVAHALLGHFGDQGVGGEKLGQIRVFKSEIGAVGCDGGGGGVRRAGLRRRGPPHD